jgi:hypothetical protein
MAQLGLLAKQNPSFPSDAAQEIKIKVDFANAPKGTRATVDAGSGAVVDLSVGHQMGGGY